MSENCFVRQEASSEIIANVASFCSECYSSISQNETIFYDMQNYRYLCRECKDTLEEQLDENCELIESGNHSLFST